MIYLGQFRYNMKNQPTIVSYAKITKPFPIATNLQSKIFFLGPLLLVVKSGQVGTNTKSNL